MNETMVRFGKDTLKELLSKCTEQQQHRFKQMYCFKDLGADINHAVDNMPEDKIDWAITQCERTVRKNLEGELR